MTRDPEARAKAIDRIKKCLRLAQSNEAHEAAAALRQAQKLMAEWGLEQDDLDAAEMVDELVRTKEAFGGCAYLHALVNLIDACFGVSGVWEQGNGISRKRANVRYIGPAVRVALAVYAHRVVDRSVRESWESHRLYFPHDEQRPGARQSFRLAFLLAIRTKIEAFAMTEKERDGIKKALVAKYGGALTEMAAKDVELDDSAADAGFAKGRQFDIHRPMTAQRTGLEHKA